ncbi:MAG: 30S ribosomal protein S20 [Clostridiales bacterium]|jgi:small subunit ribosomal protein S20|nr:30S ribosomal protein S20 [Clostridiales bacterium]
MPNIKSSKKRVKVIATKTNINKSRLSRLKTDIKKANLAIESGEASADAVKVAIKRLDQAVAKGILHKNTAARKKSSLVRKLNAANA